MAADPNDASAQARRTPLRSDQPIEKAAEDRFGRAALAKEIADQIRLAPTSESFVVGVMGTWGSGKSSILNMIAEDLEPPVTSDREPSEYVAVVRFNPWMFSGSEQLVRQFFEEVGAQLGERAAMLKKTAKTASSWLGAIAPHIKSAGALVPPSHALAVTGAGLAVEALSKILAALSPDASLDKRRRELVKALKAHPLKIVVLIDDLDRLRPDEVREMMKLVRLVGDLPDVVYVLAFDRSYVASALTEGPINGQAYLEKIVQSGHDVPSTHPADLEAFVVQALAPVIREAGHPELDDDRLVQWFRGGVIPRLLYTPRNVRRYETAIRSTLGLLNREVSLADVLALESVRLFMPDVFAQLPSLIDCLTSPFSPSTSPGDAERRIKEQLFSAAKGQEANLEQLLAWLFPRGARRLGLSTSSPSDDGRFERDRRVAHERWLRFYLDHRHPVGMLPVIELEKLFRLVSDESALISRFDAVEAKNLPYLFEQVTVHGNQLTPAGIEAMLRATLRQDVRVDQRGGLALNGLVQTLLQRVPSARERTLLVARLASSATSLSASWLLLNALERAHEPTSASQLAKVRERLVERTLVYAIDSVAGEWALLHLVELVHATGTPGALAWLGEMLKSHVALVALLRCALAPNPMSLTGYVLKWDLLASLFGKADLARRVRLGRRNGLRRGSMSDKCGSRSSTITRFPGRSVLPRASPSSS